MAKYINPFVDFGFKYLFGREESKILLIDFLNSLLCDEPGFSPIVDLEYLDKESKKEKKDVRGVIYDIHCRTDNGKRFIVEMQNDTQACFFDRIIYYSSGAVSGQMRSGQNWSEGFMPVYCVCFMNFILENDPEDFRIDAAVCNLRTGKPISDKLRYVFIQTPLFGRKSEEECKTFFDKWMYNIIHMPDMESIAFTGDSEIFRKLEQMASFASLGEADRLAYEIELKAYRDLKGQLEYARDKGLEEGRTEEKMEMILNMAKEGLGLETIARVARVAVDEIKKILGKNK